MKRMLKAILSIFLILGLLSALGAAYAAADPDALQISAIKVFQEENDTVLQISVKNTGNTAIVEYGLALAFVNQDRYQIFGYPDTMDGYDDEICNWFYEPETPIAPGETFDTEDIFQQYNGTAEVAIAIRYYVLKTGREIWFPESQWVWIWPGEYAQSTAIAREYYAEPPESLYTIGGELDPGYWFYLLDDYNAYYYGKNQGGEWISRVEPGSPADIAGLQAGDLVLFVDGVKPTENVYAVPYAMAALAAGEKVDWVYERDGVIYVTRIVLP